MQPADTADPGTGRGDLRRKIPVLTGPTGAGKTDLIAGLNPEQFEIVSLDSRQIYRHLTIGTAAPEPEVQKRIAHHLVGIINPDESFTAERYRELAGLALQDIIAREKIPIIVGGSGFYLQMLQTGPFSVPGDPHVIHRVKAMDHSSRVRLLQSKDPNCFVGPGQSPSRGRIHANDTYRVERFLILVLSSGKTIAELWEEKEAVQDSGSFDFEGFFLNPDRDVLWDRLKGRAELMVEQGIREEAEECRKRFGAQCPGLKIIGYPETLACLDGKITEEELKEKLWILHRQFARRQRIWFQKREYVTMVPGLTAEQLGTYAVNLFYGSGINH